MADGRAFAAPDVGEELRRLVAWRRRALGRLGMAAAIGCSAVPLAVSTAWTPVPLLVWNASASAPVGLYRLRPGAPVRRGDMVAAWAPGPARALAARRQYLPAGVPLVKRVAAAAGNRICAAGPTVSIDGRTVAERRGSDFSGRPMPWWSGCRELRRDEYFLLMDSPASFDGRYFGVTRGDDVLGRAELLWAR
jgi:conjugative transfer signal peptidase TraF